MTNTPNNRDRLDRIEAALDRQVQVNAELLSSVNSLVNAVNQHQENFMVVVAEIRSIREDMQIIQTDIQRTANRKPSNTRHFAVRWKQVNHLHRLERSQFSVSLKRITNCTIGKFPLGY